MKRSLIIALAIGILLAVATALIANSFTLPDGVVLAMIALTVGMPTVFAVRADQRLHGVPKQHSPGAAVPSRTR
jgi:hypothetical protein